jgi:hypothetical protein
VIEFSTELKRGAERRIRGRVKTGYCGWIFKVEKKKIYIRW